MAKTYGKFWNTWQTDKFSLPLGLPALMTSPQEQAQVPAELVAARDKRYGMSTEEVEKNRQVRATNAPTIRSDLLGNGLIDPLGLGRCPRLFWDFAVTNRTGDGAIELIFCTICLDFTSFNIPTGVSRISVR